MSATRTFYVESLGCAKNQVDSELMIAELEAAGWRCVADPQEAAAIVVNTCGFIADAKKQSIETTLSFKSRFPDKKIYMVGCLTERYAGELSSEIPEMDGFLGNGNPSGIRDLLDGKGGGGPAGAKCGGVPPQASLHEGLRERKRLLSFPGSVYVKISEGCGNRCTYCAIPLIRGDLRSRPREEVAAEIKGFLGRGIREIVLIAQDLGSYGTDGGKQELPDLLRDISGLDGSFWIRLLYIHPDHFPREILPVMARDPRLLPYFDIPFQHASPRVLSAMGRREAPDGNLQLIREVRRALPDAVIRSTFLVGFPGETDEDFDRLLEFQESALLDWMGVFRYSREEDTPAYRMRGGVRRGTAEERKRILEQRQIVITERALDGQLGRELSILIEEPVSDAGLSIGRAYLQAPDVDGLTVVRGSFEPGSMVLARIWKRNGFDLEGEPVNG